MTVHINIDPQPGIADVSKQIEFSKNEELLKHLNQKYNSVTFYPMSGPVGLTHDGQLPIAAFSRKLDTKLSLEAIQDMRALHGPEAQDSLMLSAVESICDEIVADTDQSDVYLYQILSFGPVMNEDTFAPEVQFTVRGHWENAGR